MSTTPITEPEVKHPHSRRNDQEEVAHWCELYPWYRRLMDDVHDTLSARDRHCGAYSMPRFTPR